MEAVGQKGLTTNFRTDKFDSEVQRGKKTGKKVVPFSIKLRLIILLASICTRTSSRAGAFQELSESGKRDDRVLTGLTLITVGTANIHFVIPPV